MPALQHCKVTGPVTNEWCSIHQKGRGHNLPYPSGLSYWSPMYVDQFGKTVLRKDMIGILVLTKPCEHRKFIMTIVAKYTPTKYFLEKRLLKVIKIL